MIAPPQIAVLGGTFDPPHLGHLEAVRGIGDRLGVHRFLVIPAGTPRLKSTRQVATSEQRLEMARLLFSEQLEGKDREVESLQVDDREVRRAERTGEPTRTQDTLLELRQEYGSDIAWIIGSDQLAQLHKWSGFPNILELCHWIVLDRKDTPPQTVENAMSQLNALEASGILLPQSSSIDSKTWSTRSGRTALHWLPTPARGISSTAIRADLARNGNHALSLRNDLPPNLVAYLKSHSLYGTGPDA